MFIMTSDITIGGVTGVRANAVKWKCSVGNFTDTCTISVPIPIWLKSSRIGTELEEQENDDNMPECQVGDKVIVKLGYDGNNTPRFSGFVKRINYASPLEIICEGYSYLLSRVVFTKSYESTTVLDILKDLTAGTEIKLSDAIPDIPLKGVRFKNCPGLKVLEWFQKECLLAVFFDFDTLYVGASKFGLKKPTQKIRLGWNTAEDRELKKSGNDTDVQINLIEKDAEGTVKRTKSEQSKYSQTKDVKVRPGMPPAILTKIAEELQKHENFTGYSGTVTCFLVPHFEKSYVAGVSDNLFADRAGNYFVEEIEGSFDSSGGRQKIKLRYYGRIDGS